MTQIKARTIQTVIAPEDKNTYTVKVWIAGRTLQETVKIKAHSRLEAEMRAIQRYVRSFIKRAEKREKALPKTAYFENPYPV